MPRGPKGEKRPADVIGDGLPFGEGCLKGLIWISPARG
jgi:hypothetical protein